MSRHLLFMVLPLLALSACSRTHVVQVELPDPLISPIQATAHLLLSDEFRQYQYVQSEEDRPELTMVLGQAHTSLFERIFTAMFSNLTDSSQDAQLVIVPEVNAFQFSLPKETGTNFYEVWVRYRLQVMDQSGQPVADWLLSGYGRVSSERFQMQGTAMNEATAAALRDLGTQLAIGFAVQPDIVAWMQRTGVTQ